MLDTGPDDTTRLPARDARPGREGYRAHIDGVRAIAVVLVILFHLGYAWMPGGFIGVDVFFVISGYLITGLLLREVSEQGTIRMRRFYARRMRRLLAASALVILAVIVLAAWLLDAVDKRSVGQDATAAALYVANWQFVADSAEYFTPGDVPSPLIHFWSLAIEEQFYLVWPALFLGLWRLSRRGRTANATWRLVGGIVVLLGVSAVLSVVLTPSTGAYYGTHTRAYQLLTGAGLVFLVGGLRHRVPHTRAVRAGGGLAAAASLAAIVCLATAIPGAFDYPGLAGLAVTFSSAVLIAALELAPVGVAQRVIGHAAPALIGRMSYSLYIWHWPVLAFAPVLARRWNLAAPTERWAQITVIALAAATSYALVERPVRFRVWKGAPARAVVAAGLAVSALVAVAQIPVLEPRDQAAVDALAAVDDSVDPGRCPYTNQQWEPLEKAEPCVYRKGGRPVLALVGDSHALQWEPAFDEIAKGQDITIIRVTRRGCPASWLTIYYFDDQGLPREDYGCRRWRARVFPRLIERYDPDVVFVASRSHLWGIKDGDREVSARDSRHVRLWSQGWDRTLRTLTARGATVVVSQTTPNIPFSVPACLAQKGLSTHACDAPVSRDREVVPYNRVVAGLPRRFPAVRVVDPTALVCPRGICPAVIDGVIVHRDDDHVTATFARSAAGGFERLLARAGVRLLRRG